MDSLTVRGLRTEEDEKFIKFFNIVQKTANRDGFVFFLDVGDGREINTEDIFGEDLFGWLIPLNKADEFETEWNEDNVNDNWADYELFAVWNIDNGEISIKFGIGNNSWQELIPKQ